MKRLIDAVTNGNLEEVKNMLNTHPFLGGYKGSKSIDTELNKDKENALYIACSLGFVEIVEELITAGAIIDELGPMEIIPFMIAVIKEQVEVLEKFKDFQSFEDDLKYARGFDGSKSIHLAAYFGNIKSINFLLENGAGINAKRKDGSTALYVAVEQNKVEAARFLLDRGASMYISAKSGKTAYSLALESSVEMKTLFSKYRDDEATKLNELEYRIQELYGKISRLNEKKSKYTKGLDNAGLPVIFSPSAPPSSPHSAKKLYPENPEFSLIDFDGIVDYHNRNMYGGNPKINF